jgi:hypothetical protein
MDWTGSLSLGATLGNYGAATSLYNSSRAIQYGAGLSFINYTDSAGTYSYPEFAFGPLGATN